MAGNLWSAHLRIHADPGFQEKYFLQKVLIMAKNGHNSHSH